MAKEISRESMWKCDTPQLLKEILNNKGTAILRIPLNIFKMILAEVAERAIELNDPILNELMCDLRLYETPEPSSVEYREFMKKVRIAAQKEKNKNKKNERSRKNNSREIIG